MKMACFDCETNGKSNSTSVLEIAIIKFDSEFPDKKESFHRYYYPTELFSYSASMIHGITPEILKTKVGEFKYFKDDPDVMEFFSDADVLIAHNISFDQSFLPDAFGKKMFCTMKSNKGIIGLKNRAGNLKNPKLEEACNFYSVDFDSNKAHTALYDTEKLTAMFEKMLQSDFKLFDDEIKESGFVIRNHLGECFRLIKKPLIVFEYEGIDFFLTEYHFSGSSKEHLYLYERKTGNFVLSFIGGKETPETYRLPKILDIMQNRFKSKDIEKMKLSISKFLDNNETKAEKTLFDFV